MSLLPRGSKLLMSGSNEGVRLNVGISLKGIALYDDLISFIELGPASFFIQIRVSVMKCLESQKLIKSLYDNTAELKTYFLVYSFHDYLMADKGKDVEGSNERNWYV